MADNFTTFMCRLSCSLAASAFWNRQGMFRDFFFFNQNGEMCVTACLMLMTTLTLFTFYDLQSALNLKMMHFGTWPSHCVSGCDGRNSRLIMIGMEKPRNSEPYAP